MNRTLLFIGAPAALALAGVAIAQTVGGLDIQAIQKRAQEQAGADATALVNEVQRRGDTFMDEARATADQGHANLQRYASTAPDGDPSQAIDLDAMVKGITAKQESGSAPQFIVFASLSMPPETLKPLLRDVSKAGGAVVFQGFPNNSARAFSEGLTKSMDKGAEYRGVGIDPRLFRAFNVTSVPTYVVVSSDFDPCDGLDCVTTPPPHDRLTGNVTVRYALETMAQGGGPGARVAAVALKNLDAGS